MRLEDLEWEELSMKLPGVSHARVGEAIFWRLGDTYAVQLNRIEPVAHGVGPLEAQCLLIELLSKEKT